MKTDVRGNDHSLTVEVGPEDEAGNFEFGMSAETSVRRRFGSEVPEVAVSFGAIGSHDVATARRRAEAYIAAANIAEEAQRLIEVHGAGVRDVHAWMLGKYGLGRYER